MRCRTSEQSQLHKNLPRDILILHKRYIYGRTAQMNKQKFQQACEKILHEKREKNGIGTLGEKTVHAVLKTYFDPTGQCHETKVGRFVADIYKEDGIMEIQTAGFNQLRKKLEAFLKIAPVTVVYPIPRKKWVAWIDKDTGEVTKKRKSPKQGQVYDILYELYWIKQWLKHPHMRFCLVFMDVVEYRYLNGWSEDRKRGASRYDRIPVEIVDEVWLNCPDDYRLLVPEVLNETFTSKDFKKETKLSLRVARTALNVLHYIEAVKRVGKTGNSYLYERSV